MKRLSSILLVLMLAMPMFTRAQEPQKELTRKEKRELRKQEEALLREAMSQILSVAIDSQQWVLEANTLANKYGNSVPVNSNLNFIAIDRKEAFIQLGSNTGMGANGVGGISVRANISKYDVKRNKKKGTYYISIYTTSALGSFDIRVDCNGDGQIAGATVQGNGPKQVKYRGQVVPLDKSNVYKGTPII